MPFFVIELACWVVRTPQLPVFNQIGAGNDLGLKHPMGFADDHFIGQNPTGGAT